MKLYIYFCCLFKNLILVNMVKKNYFLHETSVVDEPAVIGEGTRIWHFSHIMKNSSIGKNCNLGQNVFVAPNVEIGDYVILAGQVGIRDHVKIGNRAIAGAQTGVGSDIPEGQIYSGSPAIPHKSWLRAQSIYAKLPNYIKRIQELERKLASITETQQDS